MNTDRRQLAREPKAGSATAHSPSSGGASTPAYVIAEHVNDLGDWCPYSGEPFDPAPLTPQDEITEQPCPQLCRGSWVSEADPVPCDPPPPYARTAAHPTREGVSL